MKRPMCENRMSRVVLLLSFALSTISVVGALAGEDSGGDVFGVVVTSDGSAWPGVLISLTGGDVKQKTVSDNDGAFRFTSVPPGDCVVVFEAQGKKKMKRKIPVATGDVDLGTIAID
ncbi:MAG: carboxypeptidase-like regulatory domain-containing protein [Thermoanaerobaculales bacterium]|nr:carboxypeptidase-like regulatory domain-containing protein [Thermoanaerobaculales bacterium]